MTLTTRDLQAAIPVYFPERSSVVVFQDDGEVLMKQNGAFDVNELKQMKRVFETREGAIEGGIRFEKQRYEVFRYHPPLVYGRTVTTEPNDSTGIAVMYMDKTVLGQRPCFALVTYKLPETSARMVGQLQAFCTKFLMA